MGGIINFYGNYPAMVAAIALQNVYKVYNNVPVVNDLSFSIARGEIFGLLGPNGAGKTTLIRLLAMAEEATIGEIYLYGDRLLKTENNLRLKQYVGYLPDDFPIHFIYF
jgi:ABC-2 type transport system ATP-binding protein